MLYTCSAEKAEDLSEYVRLFGEDFNSNQEDCHENANVVGLLISVDRKEKLENGKSALQTVQDEYGIEAHSIVNINDIIAFLESEDNRKKINAPEGILDKVYAYREKWGAQ